MIALPGCSAVSMRVPSGRPMPGEYGAYAHDDIRAVGGDDIVAVLDAQGQTVRRMFARVHEEGVRGVRYAPDKWTVKEVFGHMMDDERIFAYRSLCIARGDPGPYPSFDQDDYQRRARHEQRPLRELRGEYASVRRASLTLFESLVADEWLRRGVVADYSATVRGLAFHLAGHELRHLRFLRTRYEWPGRSERDGVPIPTALGDLG